MPKYQIKLVDKKEIANGTMEFTFEKPEGFEFRAGQFCDITLIDPPETDDEGNTRGFSIVAAPYEDYIAVATRLRDTAFKRVFRALATGAEVVFDAPYGDYTLHKTESRPAVFIIGGIGVTPVLSMIKQATHDKTAHKIILIHSNKTPQDAPFENDFKQLAEQNPNFTFIPAYSAEVASDVQGEHGIVDAEMVKRHVSDLENSVFYLSGPDGMVKALRTLLVDLQVNEDNIKTEEFDGY